MNLIYFQNFGSAGAAAAAKSPQATDDTLCARGITCMPPNLLVIGTSYGSILIYEVPYRGTNVRLVNEILEKDLKYGVVDLCSQGHFNGGGGSLSYLACSDTNGNVFVWSIDVYPAIKLAYRIKEAA